MVDKSILKASLVVLFVLFASTLGCKGQNKKDDGINKTENTQYSLKGDTENIELEWSVDTKSNINFPVTASANSVFISSGSELMFVDAKSGKIKWKYDFKERLTSSPVIESTFGAKEDRLVYASSKKGVYALNIKDGSKKWIFEEENMSSFIYSSPIGKNRKEGIIYTVSGGSIISVLDARSGNREWKKKVREDITSSVAEAVPSGGETTVYFGAGGKVYALEPRSRSVEQISDIEDGGIKHVVSNSSNTIFIGTGGVWGKGGGRVYAMDRNTGKNKGYFETKAPSISHMVLSGANLYVCDSEGNAYAVDAETGNKRWSFNTSGVSSPPTYSVAGSVKRVFLGTRHGSLHAFDWHVGGKVWSFNTEITSTVFPEAGPRGIYVATDDGRVYALDWPGSRF